MIFNHLSLRDGEQGGKRAAEAFHDAVAQWAAINVVECPADVRVVVRVYANLKGLADSCTKAGLITSPTLVEDFARGFTRGKTLFDFVDVGCGQDTAVGKVVGESSLHTKEKRPLFGLAALTSADTFKLHLYDYHCRQILLGCSHDDGYACSLAPYASDEEVVRRVTLVEGTPFEKGLAALPFEKKKFAGIFRENKMPNGPSDLLKDLRRDSRVLSGASGVFTPRTNTPYTPVVSPDGSIPQLDGQLLTIRPAHLRTESTASSTTSSEAAGAKTWAKVSGSAAALPFTDLARPASQQTEVISAIRRNRKGQRLDEPMDYNHDDVYRLKKLKCCNQHYIGVGCCHFNASKADKCPHRHDAKLSTKDLYNLRVVARETPCKKGTDCEDVKCIYGHCCPFPIATEGSMRGVGCLNGDACRFPAVMHGMDKMAVKTIKVTGTF